MEMHYFWLATTTTWFSSIQLYIIGIRFHIINSIPHELVLVLISANKLSRPQGHSAVGRIKSMKNSSDSIGNQTRDIPACGAGPQLRHRVPCLTYSNIHIIHDA
jgi:hypothetical protein